MAHFDALTNLPNRILLADRLQQAMLQAHPMPPEQLPAWAAAWPPAAAWCAAPG